MFFFPFTIEQIQVAGGGGGGGDYMIDDMMILFISYIIIINIYIFRFTQLVIEKYTI